jgi:hypothetical protein
MKIGTTSGYGRNTILLLGYDTHGSPHSLPGSIKAPVMISFKVRTGSPARLTMSSRGVNYGLSHG